MMILFCALLIASIFRSECILTTSDCSTRNSNDLWTKASELGNLADEALVPLVFARVEYGYLALVMDEDDGQNDGGTTNPFGSYASFFFNGTDILPPGACGIKANTAVPRCGLRGRGITKSFMLGPGDAISLVMCTPSPMRFFSYDSIINTRIAEDSYPFYPGQNFGDAISLRNVNVSNSKNGSSSKFDQPAVIIHAADSTAADRVASAYTQSAGVDPASISTRFIPSKVVRLWDRTKDWQDTRPDFLTLIARYAIPQGNREAYETYKQTLWPARFYFAYDDSLPSSPVDPPPKSRYDSNAFNEVVQMSEALGRLQNAVYSNFLLQGKSYVETLSQSLTPTGCYDDWENVLANPSNNSFTLCTRDALYGCPHSCPAGCNTTPSRSGVIMGVMHTPLLDASYSSVGLTVVEASTGAALSTTWLLDEDVMGSAARYIPADPQASGLFAIDVMPPGKCAGRALSNPKWCLELVSASFSTPHPVFQLGERIYSISSTTIGPASNQTLAARFFIFNG